MALKLKKLISGVADIFDANSQADQQKRMAAGQARLYEDQQRAQGVQRISSNPVQRVVNTGRAVGNALVESPKQLGVSLAYGFSPDVKAAQQAQNNLQDVQLNTVKLARQNPGNVRLQSLAQRSAADSGNLGTLNQDVITNTQPRRVGAAFADTAFTAATAGIGAGSYQGTKIAALQGGKIAAAKELASQGAKSALLAAPSGAAGTYVSNPNAGAKEVLRNTTIAGGIGAALPIATAAGAKTAEVIAPKVVKAAKAADAAAMNVQPRIARNDALTLRDHSDYLAGVNPSKSINAASQNMEKVYEIAKRHNVDLTSGSRAEQLDKVNSLLDNMSQQNKAVMQGGYVGAAAKPRVTAKDPLLAVQDEQAARYKQGTVQKLRNKVGRNLLDPRNVEQRLDNAEFKIQKKAGNVRGGQKELLPEQQLTALRGRIQSPNRAAEVRAKTRFATPDGEFSVNDIIKSYGKEGGEKARAFENYRIYKDELERLSNNEKQTIPVSPDDMQAYVAQYEQVNPVAVSHNAALRAKELQEVAEKEAQGIVAKGTTENLSRYQFYTPRKLAAPEELQRPRMSGGIKSGQKGVKSREGYNEAPTSPLSLFRENSINHEKDLANQAYGLELRRRVGEGNLPNFIESINATTVNEHKALQAQAKDLTKQVEITKRLRNQLRTGVDKSKAGAAKASRQAKRAEDEVVAKMRSLLERAKGNTEDVLNDVVDRDPRYAKEAAAIKNKQYPKLSSKERQEQIRYELQQLSEKYPKPGALTRSEVLSLADSLSRTETIAGTAGKAQVRSRLSQDATRQLEDVQAMLRQSREDLKGLQTEQADVNQAFRDTTQGANRNTQSFQYRENGEVGKIELSGELAESLSKQNESAVQGIIDRGLRPVSNAQKLVWTGLLQPSFKLYNTLVKNPLLMFYNADGLSGVRPEVAGSFARQLVNTPKMAAFKKEMLSRGMAYENAFQSVNIDKSIADDIAARANLVSFFARNPVRTLGDVWKGVNNAVSSIDNAQRYAVSYGAYKRAIEQGFAEKEALDIASQASAKVFGDFDRVSQLAQAMDGLIPYTGATQAGTRALLRSTKIKPVESAAKATLLGTGMAGLAAYSIGNANEYYQDMIDSGKEFYLDSNWVIALPGAHKNPDTGEWTGIINVPLLPDIRPMNRAIWREVHSLANGDGLHPETVANEAFNQVTGDLANQLYDPKRAQAGNPATGVLPSSPLVGLGKTLAGINNYNGGQLADEYTSTLPRTQQANASTTEGAKGLSKKTGGVLTPLQADQLLGQLGNTGDILQNPDEAGGTLVKGLTKPLKAGKSQTEKQKSGAAYYKDIAAVGKTASDERTYREFIAKHEKNNKKGLLNSAESALSYLNDGELFELDKKLDAASRKRGEPGNPIYDLKPEQVQKVLTYRSMKIPNAAGQNKDKNGASAFTALGLDEKWYDDFKAKESDFYSKVAKKGTDDEEIKTFSGAVRPMASPELQAKLDYYYTLGKGTGQRSAFLKANPDIIAHWDSNNDFTNDERVALGFNAVQDEQGGSGGFGGRGGQGGNTTNELNPLQYALDRDAGGTQSKPKITVKSTSKYASVKSKRGRKAKSLKPRVTKKGIA